MIVGPNFIWQHFPKCAGMEVERLLRSKFKGQPGLHFDKIDRANMQWHHTVEERMAADPSFSPRGRKLISGFRRLPTWLLSRVHYEKQRSPRLNVTREMLLSGRFYAAPDLVGSADADLIKYCRHGVDHWIRVEHLKADVWAIFSRYLDLSCIDFEQDFGQSNKGRLRYLGDVGFYFSPAELRQLYDHNPVWRDLERAVYGDLLEL